VRERDIHQRGENMAERFKIEGARERKDRQRKDRQRKCETV
jgi:hypothetical protein